MAKDQKFRFIDFDPGGFKHPAKAKNTGEIELISKNGWHRFDFDGTREKVQGPLAGWDLTVEDAADDRNPACRVTMTNRANPQAAPKRFVVVGATKGEFDTALAVLAEKITAGDAVREKIAGGAWWLTADAFKCLGFSQSFSVGETTYHGGWSKHPQSHKNDYLRIEKGGISLRGVKTIFTIPWDQVIDISVDGPEAASKRVTAGRVAMMGVFALAAKKKTKSTVILIDVLGGDQAVFETAKALPREIAPKLLPLANQARKYGAARSTSSSGGVQTGSAPAPSAAPAPASLSVVDELAKLADLHERGVLSDEEFAAGKSKLLESM